MTALALTLAVATLQVSSLCALSVFGRTYPVTFEEALLHRYSSESFNGTWISRNEYIFQNDYYDSIKKHNVETGQYSVLLNKTILEDFTLSEASVSADGKWLAIQHDKKTIFRHSTTCQYTLFEIETGKQISVLNGSRVQLLVWAPVGSALAIVADNNIFYQSEEDRKNDTPIFRRISNGYKDIYNGVADWVYEEEVLEASEALWFSPNGTKLVFATFDDTNVRNVTLYTYGDPGSIESQYVKSVQIKYPKVGTTNPEVYLNYVDLTTPNVTLVKIPPPHHLVSRDNILGSVSWVGENRFSATWFERLQTRSYTLTYPTDAPHNFSVVHQNKEEHGWVNNVAPIWVNSSSFLTVLPQDQGGTFGNYQHLSIVKDGENVPLTYGRNVVTSIDCYDKEDGIIYYTSTVGENSARKKVYRMFLNNTAEPQCFSCFMSDDCVYGLAQFSRNCKYAVLTCKGLLVPEFNVYDKFGQLVVPLSTNAKLKRELEKVMSPIKLDITIPVDEFDIKVRLLLSPNMDPSGKTKYPVLFNVYSGPDSNKITDAWADPGWDDYLVTKREIIIVNLDGRGSGLRGDKLKFAIYHRLGGPEIEDILTVGEYLKKTYPYVDPQRFGIWGWSYGGYATAMTLARDSSNVFRCGISVAPVTNWVLYDTIYTERFMGLPTNKSNLNGYINSMIVSNLTNFHNKLFYLIHGSADDNVHYQQSMLLSRALELNDILFSQQSYTDEAHGLSHVQRHLYHSMDTFWTRCFKLNPRDMLEPGRPDITSEQYED